MWIQASAVTSTCQIFKSERTKTRHLLFGSFAGMYCLQSGNKKSLPDANFMWKSEKRTAVFMILASCEFHSYLFKRRWVWILRPVLFLSFASYRALCSKTRRLICFAVHAFLSATSAVWVSSYPTHHAEESYLHRVDAFGLGFRGYWRARRSGTSFSSWISSWTTSSAWT